MRKWFLIGVWIVLFFPLQAQFSYESWMNWQEASMQAARENKLVLVAAGVRPEKEVFAEESVRFFLSRHTVPIYVDMDTKAGKELEPRLLLTPYPVYAFFIPFGDLLITIDPIKVKEKPQLLVATTQEALKRAAVKKSNSRTIRFRVLSETEAWARAGKEEKLLFVYFRQTDCRECLWTEKNVFNLDRIADFYNDRFIPWQPDAETEKKLTEINGVTDYPFALFLNEKGKVVSRVENLKDAEILLKEGEKALQKAKGIDFYKATWAEIKEMASGSDKLIFGEGSAFAGRKRRLEMKELYRDPEVASFFNEHFINFSFEAGLPQEEETSSSFLLPGPDGFVFMESNGKLLHFLYEVPENPEDLLKEAYRVLEGRGLMALKEKYESGNRETVFLEEYLQVLGKAGQREKAGEIVEEYLEHIEPAHLKEKKNWELFREYARNPDSKIFQWIYAQREEWMALFGETEVKRKLEEVWMAGADRFVVQKDGALFFEEDQFKEYAKRLKKEKVENRNSLLRKARMKAAEKVGDWRVYTNLAEERWNEEQIPEAELYSWGVKIQENCRDLSIRYKAARWFAIAVQDLEQKERISGNIRPSSYKGFFEKLVNDLTEE